MSSNFSQSTPAHMNTDTVLGSSGPNPHKLRRRFIGPLPESVVSKVVNRNVRKTKRTYPHGEEDDHEDAGLRGAVKQHALQFFLGHGGQRENWDEATEGHVREEMLNRWNESEWGRLHRGGKELRRNKRWVGTSFDVGVFLGVDILHNGAKPITESNSLLQLTPPLQHYPSSSAAETFVTAPSQPSDTGSPQAGPSAVRHPSPENSSDASHDEGEGRGPVSSGSSVALLPRIIVQNPVGQVQSEVIFPSPSSIAPVPVRGVSDSAVLTNGPNGVRNKGKSVNYGETVPFEAGLQETPAPVAEVLARSGAEDLEDTSAGAAGETNSAPEQKRGDVFMRDRMLVRASYTEAASVGIDFDESQDRVNPHIQSDNWLEYIVVWRKDRLELYRDHATPGKEWFTGYKHLSFAIPLESTTRLSIYSFIDLTFCLTCPPAPLQARGRWLLYGTRHGTNIFVMKPKSRTRAIDWVWHLWRQLGGTLPPLIELKLPDFDTRMRMDIPGHEDEDISPAFAIFTRPNVIALCKKGIRREHEHIAYLQYRLSLGASLGLAWRSDTVLDWVWQPKDVEGRQRAWEVLCGLALKQRSKPAHLELRFKEHFPTQLHLKDGTRLDEPAAIEGFVERIRPNSQSKQSTYLCTHDGYLFALSTTHANPPTPPSPSGQLSSAEALREAEVRRGTAQIMQSTGVCDLRKILAVRRAFQLVSPQVEQVPTVAGNEEWEDQGTFWAQAERTEEDENDKGGEEGIAQTTDKGRLHMRRSFELLLVSGRVIRFETHSCVDTLEWITRLRQLVSYWRKRHQVDAHEEMDLAYHVAGRNRLTPHKRADVQDERPEDPPDAEASLPDLGVFYNWCVLENCRPILRSGRLFGRQGSRGMYKHIFLVLVSGHVVQFRITRNSSLHRRKRVINLLDTYVCSGYLAAQHLPDGQFNPNNPPLARRYQDGLESDEQEEDTLFVLWYRGDTTTLDQALVSANDSKPGGTPTTPKHDVPQLSEKRKLAVYRTRSKLERDAWVWAINAEIDKTVRVAKERETTVRNAGGLHP